MESAGAGRLRQWQPPRDAGGEGSTRPRSPLSPGHVTRYQGPDFEELFLDSAGFDRLVLVLGYSCFFVPWLLVFLCGNELCTFVTHLGEIVGLLDILYSFESLKMSILSRMDLICN